MYIVMTSSAKMPSSCKGTYANVAVVQITPEFAAESKRPSMISERARGVVRVIHLGHHNVGKTPRCAYQRAQAQKMVAEFNAKESTNV